MAIELLEYFFLSFFLVSFSLRLYDGHQAAGRGDRGGGDERQLADVSDNSYSSHGPRCVEGIGA